MEDNQPVRSYVRKVRKRDVEDDDDDEEEDSFNPSLGTGDGGWVADDSVPAPVQKITYNNDGENVVSQEDFVATLTDDEVFRL
jgi:hypothetical protein